MNKNELTAKVAKLVSDYGNNWKKISELLNGQGILAPKSKKWTRDSVRKFYQSVNSTKTPRNPEPSRTGDRLAQLARRFDDAALDDLEQMLKHWRQGTAIESDMEQRPMFAGKRKNTGVHVNEEILARAVRKLKTEKKKTGGSLSLLVELLLWKYIGSPKDALEQ